MSMMSLRTAAAPAAVAPLAALRNGRSPIARALVGVLFFLGFALIIGALVFAGYSMDAVGQGVPLV